MTVIEPQWLFATPLWQIDAPTLLRAALPRIARAVENDLNNGLITPGFNRSNFLGAQSSRWLLRDCPYFQPEERQELISSIHSIAALPPRFQISTWFNCGLGPAHNSAHVHPGAELSGVLYVQVPEGSGQIVFRDPRPQCEMSMLGKKLGEAGLSLLPRRPVTPHTGTMLVFPSWLMHQVEPGTNTHELRISLSFNIYLP